MKLYRTNNGPVVESEGNCYAVPDHTWDDLFNASNLTAILTEAARGKPITLGDGDIIAPLVGQEVWAAGVTYYRSRDARIEESQAAGGGDFYARVYDADRPELFYKGNRHRIVGSGEPVRIRSDSKWNVPEPELAVAVNSAGKIIGFSIGNDMSSRDIEGENPLYLPQAKVYDRCGSLGPGLLITDQLLPDTTKIEIAVLRAGATVFAGDTALDQLKRKPPELVSYLFRDNVFPDGCFLFTGTGIVPDGDFTLQSGDVVRIGIDSIGTLENPVM